MSSSKRNDKAMSKTAELEVNIRERRARREAARKRAQRLADSIRYEDERPGRFFISPRRAS